MADDAGDDLVLDEDAGIRADCFLDRDNDGIGAGDPVSCVVELPKGDSGSSAIVSVSGDCDDSNPARSPSLTDICGDLVDNDCDGRVDEEENNGITSADFPAAA